VNNFTKGDVMDTVVTFLVEVIVTLTASLLVTVYLRAPLQRMLGIICGTEAGAQFWTAFSSVVLIGLPVILSLTYHPTSNDAEKLFFEVMGRLSGNLGGYLAALIAVGIVISFFVLVTPKPAPSEKK
jgi:hypothetical protein